jgi:epoxyqueuosine reductase QueG
MPLTPLDERVGALAEELGADLYGVADLTPAREALRAWGGEMIVRYPRSITVGIRLMDAIVDELPSNERLALQGYRHHAYDVVNGRLDALVSRLGSAMQREGHRAMPIAASGAADAERLYGAFSHKMGARLAGLGWIGKSCLLVTPEYGPRVRWATVLTEAPLTPAGQPMAVQCGACQECVDICPPHAFTGRVFDEDEPRELRYDAHACERYLQSRANEVGVLVCGLCLYVCPYGRG